LLNNAFSFRSKVDVWQCRTDHWHDQRVLEIDGHGNTITRSAGVTYGGTRTGKLLAPSRLMDRCDRIVIQEKRASPGSLAGAKCDFKVTRRCYWDRLIAHDGDGSRTRSLLDGGQAGSILFGEPIRSAAGFGAYIGSIDAEGLIVFTRHRVANPKTRAVFNREPCMQQARHLDDYEQDQQHNRQNKRKLDESLPAKTPLTL
jgi:hypothetical protein